MQIRPYSPALHFLPSMDAHELFFRSLSREEVHLIGLKKHLYDGSWEEIVRDLTARKEGRPYVFKLETRIDEDLERIARLREYETTHDVRLEDYLHLHSAEAN